MTRSVQDHYRSDNIVQRILAAVPWQPDGPAPLTAAQLFPFDQFHGRELAATIDHAARLAPSPSAHLLDIGSGVGGPARYFSSTFGCRVTGIDLTPEFVTAANELSELSGQSHLVHFVRGDAAATGFADATFDHACCFYVGMNLPDKPAVLAEAFRVLKPGARLIWTEIVAVGTGAPHYPLPWAREVGVSHVGTEASLGTAVAEAGFGGISIVDETDALVAHAQQLRANGKPLPEAYRQANEVVLGTDFSERRANFIRSLAEGALASLMIEARKPIG